MWQANILTLLPDLYPGPLDYSIIGDARDKGIWNLTVTDIKSFVLDNKRADDKPFGGVPGMVVKADVVHNAIESLNEKEIPIFYLSPRGKKFDSNFAKELSKIKGATFVCGRYEGIDERVIEHHKMIELNIGDYILSGGDLAAMVVIDSVVRMLPDVLGNSLALNEETFNNNLLEYPLYTKPRLWKNYKVPEILLSGNHQKIKNWKIKQSEAITMQRRPDLWKKYLNLK